MVPAELRSPATYRGTFGGVAAARRSRPCIVGGSGARSGGADAVAAQRGVPVKGGAAQLLRLLQALADHGAPRWLPCTQPAGTGSER